MMNHVMGFDEVKIFHYLDHLDRFSLFSHFLNIQVFEICLVALEMFQTKVQLKVICFSSYMLSERYKNAWKCES